MRRGRAVTTLGLVTLVVGLSMTGVTDAQQAAPGVYDQTEEEQEALNLLHENKLITARTKAEEILRDRPYSIIGHYVLGRVLFEAEGSHARAMFHLGRAREIYEATWNPEGRGAGAPSELHREMLYDIARLAGQMELYEYQAQVLGYYDYLYDPDLLGERAWPLMQLGRVDEAREMANRAIGSRNQVQRSAGLNAMCAIEGEARTRTEYLQACQAALEDARREVANRQPGSEDEGGGITVDAYNAALAGLAALHFEQAEDFAKEGIRRLEITPANPWRLLMYMYLDQGRLDDALGALRSMQSWRKRQPAYLRDQARAENDAAFATLVAVAGEHEVALRAITRSIEQPDRRGLTTGTAEQARATHALLRRVIRRAVAEEHAEEASLHGFGSRFGSTFTTMAERMAAWPDDERVSAVMTDDEVLISSIRPYVSGSIVQDMPWLTGELVDVLGAGVVAVALREARRLDQAYPEVTPYYDAREAEVRLAQGDEGQSLALAQRALETLPSSEVLLRARVAAVASEAARESGQIQLSYAMLEQVLQLDPGTLRRMGLTLPASVRATTGGAASEAADIIERSPRLRSAGSAFQVLVSPNGDGLRACLLGQHGNQLACAAVLPEEEPPPDTQAPPPDAGPPSGEQPEEEEHLSLAQRLAREFHRQAFSARIALSNVDLRSLDGRTIAGQELAREQLQGLLEEEGETPAP